MKTLCMCQQAVHKTKDEVQKLGHTQSHFTSYYPEEEAQLMFVSQFNCTFAQRKGTVITIYVDGKLERHEELAYLTI